MEKELGRAGALDTGSNRVQRAPERAPGKVTRTSKLPGSRAPAVQRKQVADGAGAPPTGRSAAALTDDLHMDMAHRGLTALAERGSADPASSGRVVQRQEQPQSAQAPASSPGSDAAAPATDELGALLATLQVASNAGERRAATTALTTWCRDHIVDRERLGELLRSSLDDASKTRIIGELRAEIARNEFLLGWSYEGGVTAGGSNGWENTSANRGTYPDHYMEEVETYGRESGAYWCTSFAGHTATRLGFEAAPGEDDTSMFWSGYRLDLWARQGTLNGGTRVTPEGQEVAAGAGGSAMIRGSDWQTLYNTLDRLHRNRPSGQSDEDFDASLGQAADDFLADHATPQAGDMFVYDDENRIAGNSHTNMVERYDAATRTIYTIGGNEGQAVGGRRVVLTDRAQVRGLASMVRIGAGFYTDQPAAAPEAGAGPQGAPPEAGAGAAPEAGGPQGGTQGASEAAQLGAELVRDARAINTRIVEVAHGRGTIQSDDAGATVLEWQTGSTTSDASSSDT